MEGPQVWRKDWAIERPVSVPGMCQLWPLSQSHCGIKGHLSQLASANGPVNPLLDTELEVIMWCLQLGDLEKGDPGSSGPSVRHHQGSMCTSKGHN